jgi:hypothetical protein
MGIVQRFGSAGNAALFHNGHEDTDVLMVHSVPSPFAQKLLFEKIISAV